jgi:hypothetical protein
MPCRSLFNIRAALSKLTFLFMSDVPPAENFLLPQENEKISVGIFDTTVLKSEDNRTLCESSAVKRIAHHKADNPPYHERVVLELIPRDSKSNPHKLPPCAYAERFSDQRSSGSLSAAASPANSSVSVDSISRSSNPPKANDVLNVPDRKTHISFDKQIKAMKDGELIRIVTFGTPPSLAQVMLMMQAIHRQRPLYTLLDVGSRGTETETETGGQCYWFAAMLCAALESKYDGQASAGVFKRKAGNFGPFKKIVKEIKAMEVEAVLLKFDEAEKRYHIDRERKSVLMEPRTVSLCQRSVPVPR